MRLLNNEANFMIQAMIQIINEQYLVPTSIPDFNGIRFISEQLLWGAGYIWFGANLDIQQIPKLQKLRT
ncbi:hypothetical protein Pelo_3126 [Pelomyxa schiedti]|nr:hypothetical protein Pelo_3126 [Pelomyxa schiedti]